ncbi:MAG: trypsin-like peptidase domain-containing protein [Zavarzinella sp.]
MKTVSKTIFFGLCTFAGGVVGSSIWNMPANGLNAGNRPAPEPVVTLTSSGDATGALNDRFEAVVHKLSPSVVSIEATKPPAPGKLKPTEESGSGVIVELEGLAGRYVITNNHVISGAKPNQIVIHFHNEKIINPTRVWVDAESDLAVMEIDASLGQPALLGDSDRSREGNWVLAFGSPFGLNRTVTHGIISARDRGQVSLGSSIRIKNFLQTDAAINPGSSGGRWSICRVR